MKKKIAVVLSVLIVLSAVAFTGSAISKTPAAQKHSPSASTVNQSTEVAKVSLDEAIDIALKDAGINREDAVFRASPNLDKDERNQHYDVEFYHNGVEYDYEVAVNDGAVLKAEKEREKLPTTAQNKVDEAKEQNEKQQKKPSPAQTTTKKAQQAEKADHISVEQAKEAALKDAGKKAEDVQFKKAVYDVDDRIAHFDIKFVADGYEYEYEVKAADGKILEKDVDKLKGSAVPAVTQKTQENNNYIAKDKALEAALAHAKVDKAQVKFSKVELDRDDLIVHYDVEFVSGAYEYEYEINAESGKIIKFDKDFND